MQLISCKLCLVKLWITKLVMLCKFRNVNQTHIFLWVDMACSHPNAQRRNKMFLDSIVNIFACRKVHNVTSYNKADPSRLSLTIVCKWNLCNSSFKYILHKKYWFWFPAVYDKEQQFLQSRGAGKHRYYITYLNQNFPI